MWVPLENLHMRYFCGLIAWNLKDDVFVEHPIILFALKTELICDCKNTDIFHRVHCISRLLVISFLYDFEVQILHSNIAC
jgi:hypothetical protein